MTGPCRLCPFSGGDVLCAAIRTGHARFCEAIDPEGANPNPALMEGLIRLSLELAGKEYVAPPMAHPAAATVPVAESLRLLKIARACEHRDTAIPCGCSGLAICRLGKGRDGVVSLAQCVQCVAGRDTE